MLIRLFREESGHDLLEYALLAGVIGVAGAVALALMPGVINAVYSSWDAATQDAWVPPDPVP